MQIDPVAGRIAGQPDGALRQLDDLLGRKSSCDECVITEALAVIEASGVADAPDTVSLLERHSLKKNQAATWLVAQVHDLRGDTQAALAAWDRVVSEQVGNPAEAHLARARVRGATGQLAAAYDDLRRAATLGSNYRFLSRAAMLLRRLQKKEKPTGSRTVRVAVLSSTTTDLLVPLLELLCLRDGIVAECYCAPFGNIQQEAFNQDSGMYRFAPDIVLVATNWRDAHLPEFSSNPSDEVERVVSGARSLWTTILANRPCHIIQHNCDVPPFSGYGNLTLSQPGGRGAMLRDVNRELLLAAPSSVSILDLDFVSSLFGKLQWHDAPYWHTAKQTPAASALPLLVEHQAALIRAKVGLGRKVLVLDLDNTLWGGVVGEDGVEGIQVGPPSAVGEAHLELQRYALALKERGVLLAICSKNNEEDALQPFRRHDAMALKVEDFAAIKANWLDKPANLRAIAAELNLGMDSLVFLDDNPIERAAVRAALPEVAVPELGADPSTFVGTLDAGRYFDALGLFAEDLERHASYRANAARAYLQESCTSLEEFLRSAQMESQVAPVTDGTLGRVVQLLGKTNQFNLTSRRHSEERVRRMMSSADAWTCTFKLRDKFGDYGLIGVLLAERVPSEPDVWEIDTWLMSCRVLGRGMERFMAQEMIEALRLRGARRIRGVYVPTVKNSVVAELYPQLGFVRASVTAGGEVRFLLDASHEPELSHCIARVAD